MRTGAVARGDHSDHRPAVIGHRDFMRCISTDKSKTVHKIGVVARYKTIEKLVCAWSEVKTIRNYPGRRSSQAKRRLAISCAGSAVGV